MIGDGILLISGASAAALIVVHSVTFAIGHRIGRYNVVDVAWGWGSSPLPPFRRYWAAATRPAGGYCWRWWLSGVCG
ncbi:hypothetical protein MMRN_07700 [Mycobacterium marinum]|nr:hypothetical protein MMRN_07700 [Mycobacterium marinum]